jgi:3-methyladenine DNA glycosylase AlkD
VTITQAFENLLTDMRAAEDPELAEPMVAYMRGQFAFLGIKTPARKAMEKPLVRAARTADADDVVAIVHELWAMDEREYQYVGSVLMRAKGKHLGPRHLDDLHTFITTKSWWDTVDALASHPVGTLVSNYPDLVVKMDEWIDDDDFWVARTAILHQLRYKHDLDQDRLFGYVLKRAGDTEFFIRKALGWALRDYARVAPDAVRSFVGEHEAKLSGLTKREALKHL